MPGACWDEKHRLCNWTSFPPPPALIPTGQAGLPPAPLAGHFGGSEGEWLFLVVVCLLFGFKKKGIETASG